MNDHTHNKHRQAEAGTTEGGIFYDGISLGKVRSNVGYVTQDDIMYEAWICNDLHVSNGACVEC